MKQTPPCVPRPRGQVTTLVAAQPLRCRPGRGGHAGARGPGLIYPWRRVTRPGSRTSGGRERIPRCGGLRGRRVAARQIPYFSTGHGSAGGAFVDRAHQAASRGGSLASRKRGGQPPTAIRTPRAVHIQIRRPARGLDCTMAGISPRLGNPESKASTAVDAGHCPQCGERGGQLTRSKATAGIPQSLARGSTVHAGTLGVRPVKTSTCRCSSQSARFTCSHPSRAQAWPIWWYSAQSVAASTSPPAPQATASRRSPGRIGACARIAARTVACRSRSSRHACIHRGHGTSRWCLPARLPPLVPGCL